jgi:hypothetical protein
MRIKGTNEETNEERWAWKESRTVCLTFRTKEFSPHVYFCNMKIEVSTFVAAVRQYYECGSYGHIRKFCKKEKQTSHAEKQNMEGLVLNNA